MKENLSIKPKIALKTPATCYHFVNTTKPKDLNTKTTIKNYKMAEYNPKNIEDKVGGLETLYKKPSLLGKVRNAGIAAVMLGYSMVPSLARADTILNKTGARPMDYEKSVWMDESWGAHFKDSYENLKNSFSSPKKYITAPFNLVNLVLVGANEVAEGALNVATSPFWGVEEKLRDTYDGEKGGVRKFIRYLTDSLPGGRTFDTSARRTFNINYVGENKDALYETFPASIVTNLLAGDFRATWDPDHKVWSIIKGTGKTAVRIGSIAGACSGGSGGGSSGGGSGGGASAGGGGSGGGSGGGGPGGGI